MWAVLSGVSARRRRRLRAEWTRADEATIRKRHDELALDADSVRILGRWARTSRDAELTRRILTVVDWADGWPPGFIAEAFRCAPTTVHRTLNRYRDEGLEGRGRPPGGSVALEHGRPARRQGPGGRLLRRRDRLPPHRARHSRGREDLHRGALRLAV